jgi:hypothetical protein
MKRQIVHPIAVTRRLRFVESFVFWEELFRNSLICSYIGWDVSCFAARFAPAGTHASCMILPGR